MGHGASRSAGEHLPWECLMHSFLALLEADGPRLGDQVCELFFADSWFQGLVEKRARQAVESHAVPRGCGEDLQQAILLLFLQKARNAPDLRVKRELVADHFGGWIWSIVDDFGLQAIQSIRRLYRFEARLVEDVASRHKGNLDREVDLKLLIAEMPILTQTILSLFDEGFKLTEIADLVGEKYWKVCELQRNAVAHLRERLSKCITRSRKLRSPDDHYILYLTHT